MQEKGIIIMDNLQTISFFNFLIAFFSLFQNKMEILTAKKNMAGLETKVKNKSIGKHKCMSSFYHEELLVLHTRSWMV